MSSERGATRTREGGGISVHGRFEVRGGPEVQVHRHHTVTTSYSDEPTRTVVHRYGTWRRYGVYHRHHYVRRLNGPVVYTVRHRRHYVEAPYIVHRRFVHRYETSGPSVSVGYRTTRESEHVGVRGSLELRTHGARDASTHTEMSAESKGQMTRTAGDRKGAGGQPKLKQPESGGEQQSPQD